MIETARRDERATEQVSMIVTQMWRWHVRGGRDFCPTDTWSPAINVYQLEQRVEVCVDLAGVAASEVEVRVEPGRLVVRGQRGAPEPARRNEPMRIITMEIDHGPFCRVVPVPEQIDLRRVTSEFRDGLLWVRLPMRAPA